MFDQKIKQYVQAKEQKGQDGRLLLGVQAGKIGVAANVFLFLMKLFAGWTAGSVSIMADAMNNLADSASSLLTLIGFHFASKPPDQEHPYGHARSEYISSLLVSVVILLVGYQFLTSSIQRVLNPANMETNALIYILLILSIVLKLILSSFYRSTGKVIDSPAIHATAQDSLNDVYTTLVVLIAAAIEGWTGWQIDGIAGIIVALYILYSGYQLIKDSINDLLGPRPDESKIREISRIIESYSSLIGYHDLLVHNYGPGKTFASVHIEIDDRWSLTEAHEVIDEIEKRVEKDLTIHLVCHLDPVAIQSKKHTAVYRKVKRILRSYDLNLSFHDFRIEEKPERSILHFDVVVPDEVTLSDEELYRSLKKNIRDEIGDFELEIQFDRIYFLKK